MSAFLHKNILFLLLSIVFISNAQASDTTILNVDVPYDGLYNLPVFDNVEIVEWRDHRGKVLTVVDSLGDDVNALEPVIFVADTTVFTVTYIDFSDNVNFIYNGDFEIPFSDEESEELSDYVFVPPGERVLTDGTFGIGDNPRDLKPYENWCFIISENTKGENTKQMLYIDGDTSRTTVYKTETILDVVKGEKYVVGAHFASLNVENPYRLSGTVNNAMLGSFGYVTKHKTWHYYYAVWTADKSGKAEFRIINNNNIVGGNDFAIDDVVFFPVKQYTITFVPNNIAPNTPDYWYYVQGATMVKGDLFRDVWDANEDSFILSTNPIIYPHNGDVTIYDDGRFVYYPDTTSIVHYDFFDYRVCDTLGDCSRGRVRIVPGPIRVDSISQSVSCEKNGALLLDCEMSPIDSPYVSALYFDSIMYDYGFNDVLPDTLNSEQWNDGVLHFEMPFPDSINRTSCVGNLALEYSLHEVDVLGVRFKTRYPSYILAPKWGNVIAIRNAEHNGGFTFSDYQWMKNGAPIPNETSEILYIKDLAGADTSEYSVLLTDANDSTISETCPVRIVGAKSSKRTSSLQNIVVSPNVVSPEGTISVYVGMRRGLLKIWDVNGRLQYQKSLEESSYAVQAPLEQGVYLLEFCDVNGFSEIKRIIVR